MAKTFAEWIGERRRELVLPSGIKVVIRPPATWKAAELGPLPGIDGMDDTQRGVATYRRYVEVCLVSIGDERDPIARGLCTADDFSFEDGNAIMDAAIQLLPKKEVREDEVPLADTAYPDTPQN